MNINLTKAEKKRLTKAASSHIDWVGRPKREQFPTRPLTEKEKEARRKYLYKENLTIY